MFLASLVASAAAALCAPPEPPTVAEPIWMPCWRAPARGCRNLVPMVWLPGSFVPFGDSPTVNPEEVARKLLALPKGRRALMWSRYAGGLWGFGTDVVRDAAGNTYRGPWADAAMGELAKEWPRMLALIKYCKGDIDLLVGDCEAWGALTNWGMTDVQVQYVMADARWNRSGFGVPSLAAMLPGVDPANARTSKRYEWNLAIGRYTSDQLNEAIWKPAVAEFPRLLGCNYDGYRSLDRPAPDYNGHPQPHDNVFGNAASPALYGTIEQADYSCFIDREDPTRLAQFGQVRIGKGPWASLLLCIQQARACVRGAPDVPLVPWVAFSSYPGDIPGTVGFPQDPRCHDELVRHLALLGCPAILNWNPDSYPLRDQSQFRVHDALATDQRVDGVLTEVNERTLGRISAPVNVEPISYLAQAVLSGARRRDGKYLWRLTVSPAVASVKFTDSGKVTEFGAGELGTWIETDSASTPGFEVTMRAAP